MTAVDPIRGICADLPKTPRSADAQGTVSTGEQRAARGGWPARGFNLFSSGNVSIAMGSFEHERLLTPAEVAALFRVDPKTVTRWAQAGKLTAIRTLGGHRRYRESEVSRLLEAG